VTDYGRLINRYSELFPTEADVLRPLQQFLAVETTASGRVDRKNFRGHITASCLFVDATTRRILLFHHPKHHLILQPGGHFEHDGESALEVATRKLLQETPYSAAQVRYLPYDYDHTVPIDIDSHHINDSAPGESRHYHHDLRYVFLSTDSTDQRDVPTSSRAGYTYRWHDLEDLQRWGSFLRLYGKLLRFLSKDSARRRFYIGLAEQFRPAQSFNTLVVTHILPDAFDFLDMLNRSTRLLGVIPKPKSVHAETKQRLIDANILVHDLHRDHVAAKLPELLDLAGEGRTVLLDIGGWFVSALSDLPEAYLSKIVGIVEDTRNGQDKYEALARRIAFPFPVVSVAESPLKANEDFLVGQSVVFSADAILRECGMIIEYMECAVIGYGKIGKSIAHHLRLRGIKPFVVEQKPLRRLEAYNSLCRIRHRDWVSRNVDVVFCATGSQGTDVIDFRNLRPGAFVFSVTSSDDEFDLALVQSEYRVTVISQHVKRYDSVHNHFYLANDGNAVNFLHNAVLWEFIQLVKGGIFVAARHLAAGKQMQQISTAGGPGFQSLLELSSDDQGAVARIWMETLHLGVKLD
jgi:adenosylhomocysteinase